jgi:hypothetical protein
MPKPARLFPVAPEEKSEEDLEEEEEEEDEGEGEEVEEEVVLVEEKEKRKVTEKDSDESRMEEMEMDRLCVEMSNDALFLACKYSAFLAFSGAFSIPMSMYQGILVGKGGWCGFGFLFVIYFGCVDFI